MSEIVKITLSIPLTLLTRLDDKRKEMIMGIEVERSKLICKYIESGLMQIKPKIKEGVKQARERIGKEKGSE